MRNVCRSLKKLKLAQLRTTRILATILRLETVLLRHSHTTHDTACAIVDEALTFRHNADKGEMHVHD